MSFPTLSLDFPAPGIARLTLSRPEAANALNKQMGQDLALAFAGLPEDCRAVILTGAGEKAFCAGADLKERKGLSDADWDAQHTAFRAGRDALLACPVPVIAAVNGAAFGGGLELALACDFIYAAESARFALPESTLGIMPGLGGTQLLPRAAGAARAKEIMFAGRPFTAQEAHAWGIVNGVFPAASLMREALRAAEAIAQAAPLSVKAIKQAVREGLEKTLPEALELELKIYKRVVATQDRQEGIRAFNEKRKPLFSGS
jgi:enoyl-CoA hydratase/carnithine racemase